MLKRCNHRHILTGFRFIRKSCCSPFHISHALAMPKKKATKGQNNPSKQQSQKTYAESQSLGAQPISTRKDGSIEIRVLAKPGARQNSITDIGEDGVGIQIAAPPVDGEANSELVRYISKVLGLRKSDVSLDKGSKSRNKTLVVSSTGSSLEQVQKKLQEELEGS